MPNRLADATSPYLLQHAGNPVDWHVWGEEALALARREAKPILLSIGYSACHWCHVMAHECFEDADVAALMNELFVNVKVDREERPDLDQIYQTAHALLTRRSGGWPLTMFLTPEGAPFFGGTYFPKHGRYGLPGLVDLLPRIAAAYRENGSAIAAQSEELKAALARLEPAAGATGGFPERASQRALAELEASFDPVHGGFGGAPKFPRPADLEFALREHLRTGNAGALTLVRTTLDRMADGGIHDQLAGGFCRYSVDAQWSIPHFEKMLYDNGPLLGLYADLARITGERCYADVARGIVSWLEREMRAPDGAFWSSLDADSEGEEGRFYVWSDGEVKTLLPPDQYAVAAAHFGLDAAANFEGHAWHLRVTEPLDRVARELAISLIEVKTRLEAAKATLLAARARRVRPGLDDKILTAWNALAIAGLARAARALQEPTWLDHALAAADALRRTAWKDGRLLATRRGERAALNAYLDDYAFLLAALVELMQSRFRLADYRWARELADVLLEHFEDPAHGGFHFTSHDHERLFHRSKPGHDNATPSGNGVAAVALIALGHLAAEPRYVAAGERTVQAFASALEASPAGYATLLTALDDTLTPPASVLLRGEAAVCAGWQRELERMPRASVRIYNLADSEVPPELARGPSPGEGALAWVCRGTHCLPPMRTLAEIETALAR